MGNQNTVDKVLDMNENPDNILFRIGYSFCCGDIHVYRNLVENPYG